jgi:hypothetical protein
MTLREAVRVLLVYAKHGTTGDDEVDERDRARAIVDAAVLFVESCEDGADDIDDSLLSDQFKKLRALERGVEDS